MVQTGNDILKEMAKKEEIIADIRAQFPNVDFPSPVFEPIYYGRRNKELIPNRQLIMDATSGIQWDIVSDQYSLLTHEELLYNMLQMVPEEFGKPEINVDMWNKKARIKIRASFPELDNYKVAGSAIRPEIRMFSSYDRSTFFGGSWGARELVCSNGLVAYRDKGMLNLKHVHGNADRIDNIKAMLSEQLVDFSEQVGIWESWSQKQLDALGINTIVEELPYSEGEQKQLMDIPLLNHGNVSINTMLQQEKPVTMWNVNSAATQLVHDIKSEQRRATLEESIVEVIHKYSK
jgi:hypothetical protein